MRKPARTSRKQTDALSSRPAALVSRRLVGAAVAWSIFIFAAWLSLAPAPFNQSTALWVNQRLNAMPDAFVGLAALITTPEIQAVMVVAAMWGAWFVRRDKLARARLLAGLAGAIAAATLAHFLQHDFPSSQKPLFTPDFVAPDRMKRLIGPFDDAIMSGRSFPSERGTLFAGVAIATAISSPRLGHVALAGSILVEAMRVLLGLHYVADIVGSVCLAFCFVRLFSAGAPVRWGEGALDFAQRAPFVFYAAFILASIQLITTFEGVRWLASVAQNYLGA